MSNQDIFDDKGNKIEPEVPPVTPEPNPVINKETPDNLLRMIVNEAGEPKYKSIEDALVGLNNAQAHIKKVEAHDTALQQKLDTAQEELNKKNAALEALDRFAQKQDDIVDPPVTPVLDEGAVADLVSNILDQKETKTKHKTNLTQVTSKLKDKFGDKASEVFYDKAEELGMSREEINKLASSSPKVVLKLFGEEVSSNVTPNVSSINTDGLETPTPTPTGQLPPATKSVMAGATTQELAAEMKRHRDKVYAEHGIEG